MPLTDRSIFGELGFSDEKNAFFSKTKRLRTVLLPDFESSWKCGSNVMVKGGT